MFDIPDAKRVRREDLYAPDQEGPPSSSDNTSAQDALRQQLAALYGPIEIETRTSPAAVEAEPEAGEEEEFEFNLFAPTAPKSIPTPGDQDGMTIETPRKAQKIILEKEGDVDAPLGDGALVGPRREGWYMAEISEGRRREYESVAVGLDEIRKWTETRHFALEKPWKVTVLRMGLSEAEMRGARKTAVLAGKLALTEGAGDGDGKAKTGTKPNKKRRIILRSREKAAKEAAETARVKAEREREAKMLGDAEYAVKRNARNRERKIKRRERERRKKEALKAGVEFVDEGSGDEEEGGGGGGGAKMEIAA